MTDPFHSRLQGVVRAHTEWLPLTWWPQPVGKWALRRHLEMLRGAFQIASVVAIALFWLVGVALLVQGWVSWWAELEIYRVSTGVIPAWEFP
jgi:hypothetical protein